MTTGAMAAVGHGYGWASTVSSTNANDMVFGYSYVNPSGANYRGYGFQVRCLRE